MILLGIETSTRRSSVAIAVDGVLVLEVSHDAPRGHGAFLAPAIRQALDAVDDAPDGVAVGIGPGLYTGLRVGMATAAAFASARGIPLVGITGLDSLVARARHEGPSAAVVATIDARRGQVFWLVAEPAGDVGLEGAAHVPVVGTFDELEAVIAPLTLRPTPVRVIGEVGAADVSYPSAVELLELATPRFLRGETVGPDALRPVYLRDADVRIGWTERTVPSAASPLAGAS
jgi:tRNA threonylcarbamoyladenosine biosynthesis protein TsaB